MLVLFQQDRPHQPDDRGVIGEDADDMGAALDLLVDLLEQVGAPDLFPEGLGDGAEGQQVLLGLVHACSSLGDALGQRGAQIVPARLDFLSGILCEHRWQGGGNHQTLPCSERPMAQVRPAWTSEITSLGPSMSRSLREEINVVETVSVTLSLTLRPSNSWRPSSFDPMATTTPRQPTC
jgi:hypothetical protein